MNLEPIWVFQSFDVIVITVNIEFEELMYKVQIISPMTVAMLNKDNKKKTPKELHTNNTFFCVT